MAEAIDLDHPLLDVGMNSMQLTLLVSFLRTKSGSSFSIGELFMLPVIRFALVQTCVQTTVD
jgi:aryl carrier-like protein